MQQLIAAIAERFGLQVADLLGLAVALTGCLVASVIALRVPLFAADGGVVDLGRPAAVSGTDAADVTDALVGVGGTGEVVVHVAGAVARPGVVTLPAGARVIDALEAAGGAVVEADLGQLNLARTLADGEQVAVPVLGAAGAAGTVGEGDGVAGQVVTLPDGRLDLNAASATDLEELPGVGPVLAARIVDHRTEHGPFVTAAALREVSGIGEATWMRLRDLVGVR